MTPVYFDTGVLAKLYCTEPDSAQAVELVQRYAPPFPFTHWQELEIKTAFRLKVFRREMSVRELRNGLRNLEVDIEQNVWLRPECDLTAVLHEAERLSARYAAALGCRTLDILHVAAARVLRIQDFVTLDVRQGKLARKAGLRVVP